jgi:hypothetical protein
MPPEHPNRPRRPASTTPVAMGRENVLEPKGDMLVLLG